MNRYEYCSVNPIDARAELVRGVVVISPLEKQAHGFVCVNVGTANRLGRVCSNTCLIVTSFDPDTVRNADVAYYSYQTVPEGPVDQDYWPPPELAF
jgi:hypothetical protein